MNRLRLCAAFSTFIAMAVSFHYLPSWRECVVVAVGHTASVFCYMLLGLNLSKGAL